MGLRILLLAVAVATVECVNRKKFQRTPPPQKAFSSDRYVGDWYIQARMPSCSWAGSSEFTNFVSQFSLQPSGHVHLKDTWRSFSCASAIYDLTPENLSGSYTLKDSIGNLISGSCIVVATDYKTFGIAWGCPKYVGATCTDPYLVVKTRHREPSAHTWKIIEQLLDQFWQLGLGEMIRITHDKDACVTFSPRHAPYVAPPTIEHLKKTY